MAPKTIKFGSRKKRFFCEMFFQLCQHYKSTYKLNLLYIFGVFFKNALKLIQ